MSMRRSTGPRLPAFIMALTMYLPAVEVAAAAADFQPEESISAAAEAFVSANLTDPENNRTAIAATLDSRIRLRRCASPLETFAAPGSAPTEGRSVVGVRCRGPVKWKIYVNVTIEREDAVVVLRHHMNRGDLLTPAHLDVIQMQVSQLSGGYFRETQAVIGKRLKQAVGAGQPVRPALLSVARIIKRGQQVTLAARATGVGITMLGVAAMDGAIGDRIRVRNLSSGRQIEGIVRSPQIIEVLGF